MRAIEKSVDSELEKSHFLPATSGPVAAGREFAWTEHDFVRVKSLIYQRVGINLHDGKHAMVYSRLSRRLRETGHVSFHDYLTWLERSGGQEWQEFVNALTTNLTAFFREQHHFKILAEYLKSVEAGVPLRIWCSAASTGEEPYSILITALENMASMSDFQLTASDIDSKVLDVATQGMYRLDSLKNIDDQRIKKYFLKSKDVNSDLVRIKPELRNLIKFLSVNLIGEDWPFRNQFDVVFCRNVMIYFDSATQRSVLEKIYKVMRPKGLLFVGHAENFTEFRDLFILRGKTVYERK